MENLEKIHKILEKVGDIILNSISIDDINEKKAEEILESVETPKKISEYIGIYNVRADLYKLTISNAEKLKNSSQWGRNIILIEENSEIENYKNLVYQVFRVVKNLCSDRGIHDNESEAYLFGYLMSIFIKAINLEKIFTIIKSEKITIFSSKGNKSKIIVSIKSQIKGIYEPGKPRYTLSKGEMGCVSWISAKFIYVLLRPKTQLNHDIVYFHELFHLHRLIYKYNEEFYKSDKELWDHIIKETLGIYKTYNGNKYK